ncbi:hypothetical protein TUA1478L_33430 [Lactiplantibacillus plantarum]
MVKQADHFLAKVGTYLGKAMLVLDFENTTDSSIQNQAGLIRQSNGLITFIKKPVFVQCYILDLVVKML